MFASITVIPLRQGHSLKRAGVSCLCFPQCWGHRCGWDYAWFVKWMLGSQVWLGLCPICYMGAGVTGVGGIMPVLLNGCWGHRCG